MSDLDKNVKLGGSSFIQRANVLTDQRTEVMAQVQDVIQTVEHLRGEEGRQQTRVGKNINTDI